MNDWTLGDYVSWILVAIPATVALAALMLLAPLVLIGAKDWPDSVGFCLEVIFAPFLN